MVSIISGIIATTLGALMFPLCIIVKTPSPSAFAAIGFMAFIVFGAAITGLITSSVKLLTTSSKNTEEIPDRKIAIKGFWFSISPILFWVFIAIIGSIN